MSNKILHLVLLLAGFVAADFDAEIQKKYKELPTSEFITYFNSLNLTYTMTEYPEKYNFRSRLLKERPSINYPVVTHEEVDAPDNFDSRMKWKWCDSIRTIHDEGDCGSGWMFAAADTASDRICIHNKQYLVFLSAAEGTCILNDTICEGDLYPKDGFDFWLKKGLVTKNCSTYSVEKAQKGYCNTTCENPDIKYEDNKHFAERIYQVDSKSIKVEIFKNGPVAATMKVYEFFRFYRGGIYDYHFPDNVVGYQGVRLIGYGTENGVDFWLAASSWGPIWGEQGYFRVKREIGIGLEDSVVTGIPKKIK